MDPQDYTPEQQANAELQADLAAATKRAEVAEAGRDHNIEALAKVAVKYSDLKAENARLRGLLEKAKPYIEDDMVMSEYRIKLLNDTEAALKEPEKGGDADGDALARKT